MRRITEKTLVNVDVIPTGTEPAGDVATERRGDHRDNDEEQAGCPAGGRGRDTFALHGETTDRPAPTPKATTINVTAAAVKPPAKIAPHETVELKS